VEGDWVRFPLGEFLWRDLRGDHIAGEKDGGGGFIE
jgi:hypothetical protein